MTQLDFFHQKYDYDQQQKQLLKISNRAIKYLNKYNFQMLDGRKK